MKNLPILECDQVRSIMRQVGRKTVKRGQRCPANQALAAAKVVSSLAGLSHEQRHLIINFVAEVAAFSSQQGFVRGYRRGRAES